MKSDKQFIDEIFTKRDIAVKKRAKTIKAITGISSAVALCAVICVTAIPAMNSKKSADSKSRYDVIADENLSEAPDAEEPERKESSYSKKDVSDGNDSAESSCGSDKSNEKNPQLLCGYKVVIPKGFYVGADGMSVYAESGIRIIEKSKNGDYELDGVRFAVTDKSYKNIADGIFASAKK